MLFFALSVNLFASASENSKRQIKEYNNLFQKISEKRVGVSNQKINNIKNPFTMDSKKTIVRDGNSTTAISEITYTLNTTFDKKAKINGKWYKLNSEIGDFKLTKIMSKSVIIRNEHSKKELFIRKSNVSKIKFSSK